MYILINSVYDCYLLVEALITSSAMVLVQQVTKNAKAMVPFLKPMWAFGIAFSITGYFIWKIPITGKNILYVVSDKNPP